MCTSEDTLKNALSYLPEVSKEKIQFNVVENPMFEGIYNARLRALIMVMLGCNVYILGMKAVSGKSEMRIVLSKDWTCTE